VAYHCFFEIGLWIALDQWDFLADTYVFNFSVLVLMPTTFFCITPNHCWKTLQCILNQLTRNENCLFSDALKHCWTICCILWDFTDHVRMHWNLSFQSNISFFRGSIGVFCTPWFLTTFDLCNYLHNKAYPSLVRDVIIPYNVGLKSVVFVNQLVATALKG